MELLSPEFFSALLAIVLIDLVLAGDNAIVIALAARNLPEHLRTKAIVWGSVGAVVVRGYFDPLLSAHAMRLAACGRPLAVIVADPDRPLLPLAARQLLVAALACVDCVVVEAPVTQDWTAQDLALRQRFIEHVHARSKT